MTKPWEETWEADLDGDMTIETAGNGSKVLQAINRDEPGDGPAEALARLRLAAAAPDMCRALSRVEWKAEVDGFGQSYRACPECGCSPPRHDRMCGLDAALKKSRGET